MMKKMNFLLYLSLVMALILNFACSSDSVTDPFEQAFQFITHGNVNETNLQLLNDSLSANYQRVLTDLQVTDMPVVQIHFWQDEQEYFDEMERCLGERMYQYLLFPFPPDEIHIQDFGGAHLWIVYEYTQLVLMHMNPTIKNNPRWIFEGVSVYEAGYFVDPNDLSYMTSGDYPTFAQLNDQETTDKYIIGQVGYILIEFILDQYGRTALINLIMTNGNIQSVLNVSEQQFLNAWYDWLEIRYLDN